MQCSFFGICIICISNKVKYSFRLRIKLFFQKLYCDFCSAIKEILDKTLCHMHYNIKGYSTSLYIQCGGSKLKFTCGILGSESGILNIEFEL